MGNVVIGDPRVIDESATVLHREVVIEKTPEGKETLRITIRTAGGCSGGKEQHAPPGQQLPDVPAAPVGSSGGTQQKLKTFRPKRPEVETWKQNLNKASGKITKIGPTFQ